MTVLIAAKVRNVLERYSFLALKVPKTISFQELTNITPWAVGFSFGLHYLCTRNGQTGEENRFRVVAAIDILIDTVTFWYPPSRRGDQCGSRLR